MITMTMTYICCTSIRYRNRIICNITFNRTACLVVVNNIDQRQSNIKQRLEYNAMNNTYFSSFDRNRLVVFPAMLFPLLVFLVDVALVVVVIFDITLLVSLFALWGEFISMVKSSSPSLSSQLETEFLLHTPPTRTKQIKRYNLINFVSRCYAGTFIYTLYSQVCYWFHFEVQ